MRQLWRITDLRNYFQVGRSRVYQIIAQPGFPAAYNIAGGRRWRPEDVERWILRQRESV